MEAEVERILKKYPPLQIKKENVLDREGQRETHVFINSEGSRIIPNVNVGPEQHHRELFLWYERAFGRGWAGIWTHEPMLASPETRQQIGLNFSNDYRAVSSVAAPAMASGSKERVEEAIEAIKGYVRKYPNLYRE